MTARKTVTRADCVAALKGAADRQEKAAQALESPDLEALRKEFNQAAEAFEKAYYALTDTYCDIDC